MHEPFFTQNLRYIINGNDTQYTEWLKDVKLFPLSYNSPIATLLGLSPYKMVSVETKKTKNVHSKFF